MTERVRRYDDPCGIARALDVVGERWSMLVIRELVFSPKRFNDLRRGLGGVSPNVLSQRLSELERDGVVRRRQAGPPIGAVVYELTSAGRELLPVLEALGRWGSTRPIHSDRFLSRDALMLAMQTTVRTGASFADGLLVTIDGSSWAPALVDGTLEWRPPVGTTPKATLETSSRTMHGLVFRGLDLDSATATAEAVVAGDRALVVAFLDAFERPTGSISTPADDAESAPSSQRT